MRVEKNEAKTVEEVNEAVHRMQKKIEAIKRRHGSAAESQEETRHHGPASHGHDNGHKEAVKHHEKKSDRHHSSEIKEHKEPSSCEKKVTESNPIVDMINGLVKDAVSSNSHSNSRHKLDKVMNEAIANRVHGLDDKQ